MMIAIDPAALMSKEEFDDRLELLIKEIKETDPIDPKRPVLLPGEVEFGRMDERMQSGIPVSIETVTGLRDLAEDLDVEFTL